MSRLTAATVLAALGSLVACHRHTADVAPGRGLPLPPTASGAPDPTAPPRAPNFAAGTVERLPAEGPGEWRARESELRPQAATTITETVPGPAAAPPSRDLPAELRRLAGDPTSCVPPDAMAALPEHVHLSISATVSVSGIITSATVSGDLPSAALACVQHRLESASFSGDVPDAPRTVSATADFDRSPRPTTP